MALKVHSNSVFLVASVVALLLTACTRLASPELSASDLLLQPGHFDQRRVMVSGCLLAHTSDRGDKLLVLAATCDLEITSDFNLVSAKVLDVTSASDTSLGHLPLGPATIEATFRQYGREPLNINLSGMSRVGELVLASN